METAVANPLSRFGSLSEIFGFAVNLLIGVGWSLTLVMLALGFIKYVTSRGDKIATESAQKTITMAVVGGVGLLMVMAIRAIISNILGGTVNNVGDDIGGNLVP